MATRPRRGALGLRGRIIGLVLVTTVATLAVAALALLGPLESRLRSSALKTLESDVRAQSIQSALHGLQRLDIADLPYALERRAGLSELETLQRRLGSLDIGLGATVILLGYPGAGGKAQVVAPMAQGPDWGPYDDVATAFVRWHSGAGKRPRLVPSLGTNGDGTEVARVAIPLRIGGQPYVLAVRRPITAIPGAVSAVRNAFITAALAGLALTLILGIPLSATLVRRLRRLRQAAVRLAREGPGGVTVPDDRARDEVGDLARTFATMQRQLQHQEEARRAFVATASHELRTPLTSLDGMLELLDDDLRHGEPDLHEARLLLDRARAQSRRLARLAADLLDLSRIDAEVKLRSEPVELGELSRAVLAEFELGSVERRVDAVIAGAAGQVWALADPGSVARILRILLDNAVRHSPPDTEIKVELRDGQRARLSVCDEGPGIAAEDRQSIFERFQRGRDTGGTAGFGLGLAIGRELAARMGGELALDETYTRGAKFTLSLPVARRREVSALTVS